MNIGSKIAKLRKENHLSQEGLAEKLNVSRQTISNWELDITTPNSTDLKNLSQVFNTSIDELLENDVTNILVKKVSHTEHLAMKTIILIVISIILLLFILTIFILYFLDYYQISPVSSETILTCTIDNTNYYITYNTDNNFTCTNCNAKMQTDLQDIINNNSYADNEAKIRNYFKESNGTCN